MLFMENNKYKILKIQIDNSVVGNIDATIEALSRKFHKDDFFVERTGDEV